jgi:hypothetical protein
MFALLLAAWPIAATAEVAPEFEVHGTAEKPAIGRLLSLTGDFSVKILSELGESSVKNAYSIRRRDRQLPPMPTGPQLISTTGDRGHPPRRRQQKPDLPSRWPRSQVR